METVFGTGPSFNKVQVYGQFSLFGVTNGTKQIFWNLGLGIFFNSVAAVRLFAALPITEFVSFDDVQPLWGCVELQNRHESPGCNPGQLMVQPPLGVYNKCHHLSVIEKS